MGALREEARQIIAESVNAKVCHRRSNIIPLSFLRLIVCFFDHFDYHISLMMLSLRTAPSRPHEGYHKQPTGYPLDVECIRCGHNASDAIVFPPFRGLVFQVGVENDDDVVLFVGSGTTAAITKLVSALSFDKNWSSWGLSNSK